MKFDSFLNGQIVSATLHFNMQEMGPFFVLHTDVSLKRPKHTIITVQLIIHFVDVISQSVMILAIYYENAFNVINTYIFQ